MKFSRQLITGLAVVTLLILVVGCGSSKTSKESETQTSDSTCGDAGDSSSCGDSNNDAGSDTPDSTSTVINCGEQPDLINCDDDNVCTTQDQCSGGVCVGIPKSCEDGNACTTDSCDSKTGVCSHVNSDGFCSDDNSCTKGDACHSGACVPGVLQDCEDNNKCTIDSCDSKGGGCQNKEANCDDKNACTKDSCDPMTGCVNAPMVDGSGCTDGNACTVGDKCLSGTCLGGTASMNCEDNNLCTNDSCDPQSGCVHQSNSLKCDDGNANTDGDVCKDGVCAGVPPVMTCDDKNACTSDSLAAPCTHTATVCDDANVCTADTCDQIKGCVFMNMSSVLCNDGSACTVNDLCSSGVCKPGVQVVCNDNNNCTTDFCDPTQGCQFVPMSQTACEDGDACTIGDLCKNGTCTSGAVKQCNDNNVCTGPDSCDSNSGFCLNPPLTGTDCNDGDGTTVNDKCLSGVCKGSSTACIPVGGDVCNSYAGSPPNCTKTPIVCDDKNPCTTDSCDPTKGCAFVNNSTACEDGNLCTTGDICTNGTCTSGTVSKCDDGDPCTTDVCDPKTGACTSTAILGCGTGEVGAKCSDGIDNDGDGKTDCDDNECSNSTDYGYILYASAQYGGTISILHASGISEKFDLPANAPQKFSFKCSELSFAAIIQTTYIYTGPEPDKWKDMVKVWVQGSTGNTVDEKVASSSKFQYFAVVNPAPAKPTLDPSVMAAVAATNKFPSPQGKPFMIRH